MGTRIPFLRPDGKTAEGYLASTGKANAPGVVVIQEWWGLQDQIKGICDRLALAGYDALAPDLYGGTVVPYHDADAANREMSSLNFLEATDQLVRGAAKHLSKSNPKVGLTGFCLGGAVTILGLLMMLAGLVQAILMLFREGAVVIDVGMNDATTEEEINRIFDEPERTKRLDVLAKRGRTLVGDVEPRTVAEKAAWLTPVPGGVGPLTIAMLMQNTLRAAEMRQGL